MSYGGLMAHLNELSKYLDNLSLLFDRNYSVVRDFQRSSIIIDGNYSNYWNSFYRNGFYDFQFVDGSILYFGVPNQRGDFSFSFLGSPRKYVSYEAFITEFDLHEEWENQYAEEYEEFLSEQGPVISPAFYRYDYFLMSYKDGLHPISHIHVGYEQPNRIGYAYKLTPFSFAAFLIRQQYPEAWRKVLESPQEYDLLFRHKEKLEKVPLGTKDLKQDSYLF